MKISMILAKSCGWWTFPFFLFYLKFILQSFLFALVPYPVD